MPSSPYLQATRPAYGTGTLADVMPTALAALGIPTRGLNLRSAELDGVRRDAVLLLDGFGYHLLGQAAQASATVGAMHHGELGTLTPITATVPSSTPISLASLACGLPPGEHCAEGSLKLRRSSLSVLGAIEETAVHVESKARRCVPELSADEHNVQSLCDEQARKAVT